MRNEHGDAGGLGWLSIARLGLVQASLGAIVVLTTSTLNRVMVVELMLAAVVPGALVGLHYAVQMLRPVFGHRSDAGGRRTPWIVGGVALLALAGAGASATPFLFERSFAAGLAAAIVCYALIGVGIGASGTSLLALMATHTRPARRAAAATIVWTMMIAGIVVTAIVTGSLLDPYSHLRLVTVAAATGAIALAVTILAIAGIERRAGSSFERDKPSGLSLREALRDTWADPTDRLFTIFVFVSMLAYATQDLILEPFGGLLFGMTPGESTKLSGVQHAGVLAGMIATGVAGSLFSAMKASVLRAITVAGCIGSGGALALLAAGALAAPAWPLELNVMALGFANGAFAVAAIGTMMELAGSGKPKREGIRMGVWGAAQAISFGLGGFLGTVLIDLSRAVTGDAGMSFAAVFAFEAALFFAAAAIALGVSGKRRPAAEAPLGALEPAE